MTPTTITLSDELREQAIELAKISGRTFDEVLTEAVAQGLAYKRWYQNEVERSLQLVEAGRFASPEEVVAMWERLTTPEAMAEAKAELSLQ